MKKDNSFFPIFKFKKLVEKHQLPLHRRPSIIACDTLMYVA